MRGQEKQLLAEAAARAVALRDAVAVLIALQAKASGDSEGFLKEVSEQLNKRLNDALAEKTELLGPTETIRAEYDWLVDSARAYLETIEQKRSSGRSTP